MLGSPGLTSSPCPALLDEIPRLNRRLVGDSSSSPDDISSDVPARSMMRKSVCPILVPPNSSPPSCGVGDAPTTPSCEGTPASGTVAKGALPLAPAGIRRIELAPTHKLNTRPECRCARRSEHTYSWCSTEVATAVASARSAPKSIVSDSLHGVREATNTHSTNRRDVLSCNIGGRVGSVSEVACEVNRAISA